MNPITKKIKKSDNPGLVHDSRADIAALAEYCNMLAEKINELNKEVEILSGVRKECGKARETQ